MAKQTKRLASWMKPKLDKPDEWRMKTRTIQTAVIVNIRTGEEKTLWRAGR